MKCPKCGKEIASDSNFCEYCGIRIEKSHGKKIWIILVVLFVLCVMSGFGIVYNCGNHLLSTDEGKDTLEVVSDTIKLDNIKTDNGKDKEEQLEMSSKPLVQEMEKTESTVQPAESKVPKGYVDLGLPSGNLWKTTNEKGFYFYDEMWETFSSEQMPNQDDFLELFHNTKAVWNGCGIKYTGTNGNTLFLPAAGYERSIYVDGNAYEKRLEGVDSIGCYMTDDPAGLASWCLNFTSDTAYFEVNTYAGQSIRLIKKRKN